ncbi:hypothetical protein [Cytobacillus purgationiresistens]|uniref:Uncharacterized protein n=1 Tax=Cytobacillus purgationiresistens TaxID=863449 RepID=A0ABU0AR32_9BACI|nr:hypothetical protein [Cytobacillus purgationiresistens]MDQ0272868.1 hypothetical protein [Cytobacillus purgationiresistens]
MYQLTTRELASIEDEIRAEEITAKAINWCASQCEDGTIKSELEQIAEQHQLRIADLATYFNRSRKTLQ